MLLRVQRVCSLRNESQRRTAVQGFHRPSLTNNQTNKQTKERNGACVGSAFDRSIALSSSSSLPPRVEALSHRWEPPTAGVFLGETGYDPSSLWAGSPIIGTSGVREICLPRKGAELGITLEMM